MIKMIKSIVILYLLFQASIGYCDTPISQKIICQGSTITLTGPEAPGIKWFRNGSLFAKTQSIQVKESGVFVAVAINEHGCESDASEPIEIIVASLPGAPTVQVVQPNCTNSKGTLTIDVVNKNDSYSIDGEKYQASNIFENLAEGEYHITTKNEHGCIGPESVVSLVREIQTGSFTASETTVKFGSAIIFTPSVTGAISYLWDFGDGSISTEIAPKHFFYKEGVCNVKLTVKTSGGCDFVVQTMSISVGQDSAVPDIPIITVPSGEDNNRVEFLAYPNPFSTELYVSFYQETAGSAEVTLSDMKGSVVYKKSVMADPGNNIITLEKLPILSQGYYILKVSGISEQIKLLKI